MNKFVTLTVFTLAFAFAQAEPSYWAAAETTAANSDTSAGKNTGSYSAYCCTVATAASLFGGNDTVAEVTAYLIDNFDAGRSALANSAAQGTPGIVTSSKAAVLTATGYENDLYGFESKFTTPLTTIGSEYLAMLFYENGTDREFRVMVNDPTDAANGNALFSDNALASSYSTEHSGAWTTANVPEPTGALLLLLGMAGLALRRRRAA